MVFDECPPGKTGVDDARKSLELTARWAGRSRAKFDELQEANSDTGYINSDAGLSGRQSLFGIVQGAAHLDLRKEIWQPLADRIGERWSVVEAKVSTTDTVC